MNKFFLLGPSKGRFTDDFSWCGTYLSVGTCSTCQINETKLKPPILFEWDEEFGRPRESIAAANDCFWGDFQMLVTPHAAEILQSIGFPVSYNAAKEVHSRWVGEEVIVSDNPDATNNLLWIRPQISIPADPALSKNTVCSSCGFFTDSGRVRQLTRLVVDGSLREATDVFSIRQNHGEQLFVNERTRRLLEDNGLRNVGFYPAGRYI